MNKGFAFSAILATALTTIFTIPVLAAEKNPAIVHRQGI